MGSWVLRISLFLICGIAGALLSQSILPRFPGLWTGPWIGLAVGFCLAGLILLVEKGLKKVPLKNLLGSTVGLSLGIFLVHLLSKALSLFFPNLSNDPHTVYSIFGLLYGIFGYIGLRVGFKKGEELHWSGGKPWGKPLTQNDNPKILDTNIIIDGRIADITETGFLEGTIIIPRFVLNELQHIADASDAVKRTRGKRGLEVLRHIQKQSGASVRILDRDFPEIREVDSKLIELAKEINGKIITNDQNLSKVAELQGIDVLNINELTHSLKPVVLPGEEINIKILKEGKESGQGVAYLDDGTMIVIDNGKKQIGKTTDVVVTSVLQTPAGKMIFARLKGDTQREGKRKDYFYPLESDMD